MYCHLMWESPTAVCILCGMYSAGCTVVYSAGCTVVYSAVYCVGCIVLLYCVGCIVLLYCVGCTVLVVL